jgi:hypothetical protein
VKQKDVQQQHPARDWSFPGITKDVEEQGIEGMTYVGCSSWCHQPDRQPRWLCHVAVMTQSNSGGKCRCMTGTLQGRRRERDVTT